MALMGIWSVSNLELDNNCQEPGGNNENSGENLVASCQPRQWCSYVHGLGNLIMWENHILVLLLYITYGKNQIIVICYIIDFKQVDLPIINILLILKLVNKSRKS